MKFSFALVLLSSLLASCTTQYKMALPPTPAPVTADFVVVEARTEQEVKYPVLYGTSRKPNAQKNGYLNERSKNVHYGRVFVTVPKGHLTGSLGKKPWPWSEDTRLAFNPADVEHMNTIGFLDLARRELAAVTGNVETDYILVFIHGYNNSFEDAALRAAQLGFDLNVPPNNMMFFSWAANKEVKKYTFDEATVDASEVHLRSFLDTVLVAAAGRKVHIIAHSMGNRALLRTISAMEARSDGKKTFGQIILAAADLDRDLFEHLGPNYLNVAERATVYMSPYDFAVKLSERVHDYPRIGCGDKPHVLIDKIDNVVSLIDQDFPAHAYVASALPILTDVKNLILKGEPSRSGAQWKTHANYWTVGEAKAGEDYRCTTALEKARL